MHDSAVNTATRPPDLGKATAGSGTVPGRERSAISAVDLRVTFGLGTTKEVDALGPASLDITAGEFVSVVGPSGCGKSTLVKVVAGLVVPTSGHLDVTLDSAGPRGRVATVFQDFGLFPWKTVLANVTFALRVQGLPKREAAERARSWLNRLGLRDFESAYPSALSGGMRQRVAIARALAMEPQILLMDEPFASLDAQLRELLQEELLALSQTRQRTVVFVTHSLEEAIVLSDRVMVMTARPGRILESVPVPFGRDRTTDVRQSPEFAHLRGDLWDLLRSQVQRQLEGTEEEAA